MKNYDYLEIEDTNFENGPKMPGTVKMGLEARKSAAESVNVNFRNCPRLEMRGH